MYVYTEILYTNSTKKVLITVYTVYNIVCTVKLNFCTHVYDRDKLPKEVEQKWISYIWQQIVSNASSTNTRNFTIDLQSI